MRTWQTTAGGDLKLRRGALVYADGADAVARTVVKCLKDVQGENWIDSRRGMPWTREHRANVMAARARLTVQSVEGVKSVGQVEAEERRGELTLTVRFTTIYSPAELQTIVGA
jgi:hypothetical protein